MRFHRTTSRRLSGPAVLATAAAVAAVIALPVRAAEEKTVYRCPGNPVLYTDTLSAKEAKEKGCKTLEGAPITVVQGARPSKAASGVARSGENRVDPNDQRARDADKRMILEAELKKEEEALAQLQKDYNSGEPERNGDEKNYQKYLDRVAEMKAAIARKENDIAALKRELLKVP